MTQVLIDNCVPLNNGDSALIFGVYKQLKQKNFDVVFSTLNKKEVVKKYPQFTWYKSHINTIFYRACFKENIFSFIWKAIMFIKIVLFKNEYKESDIIISAPGGYIHSYYGIEGRLYILYICKKWLHKKVGIYSQSIGNLTLRDQKLFYKYGKELDFIFVRDRVSMERANSYGVFDNIYLTKDAAFLLMENNNKPLKNETMKVAISLRSWEREGREMTKYFHLIHESVELFLKYNYDITFLSTCQGIKDYTDDSIVAKKFISEYHYTNRDDIHVDDRYHSLTELQSEIKEFDFVIGTRLHMCILSWINQVPAFNISYEEKGKESFKYLGIDRYSVDFNSSDIVGKLNAFLVMSNQEKKSILDRIEEVSREQNEIFEKLFSNDFEGIIR